MGEIGLAAGKPPLIPEFLAPNLPGDLAFLLRYVGILPVDRESFADVFRKPLAGFDYEDCQSVHHDDVDHMIVWKDRSIRELAGKTIRLEFFLRSADFYTFRAAAVRP